MIKPVEYLAYVYYKCSWCGIVGDEVRLVETKSRKHICISCGNEDDIEPITGIKFCYDRPPTDTKKQLHAIDLNKYDKVEKSIVGLGWSQPDVIKAINSVLINHPEVTTQELFRLAIVELDEQRTKTNKAD